MPQNPLPTKSPDATRLHSLATFCLLNLHVVHVHPSELSFPSNLFSTLFLLSALSFKLTVPSDFTLPRLKLRIPGQQMIYFFTLYLLCLLALSKTWLSLRIFFIFSSPNCSLDVSPLRVRMMSTYSSICTKRERSIFLHLPGCKPLHPPGWPNLYWCTIRYQLLCTFLKKFLTPNPAVIVDYLLSRGCWIWHSNF